jgi:hypothetical protein
VVGRQVVRWGHQPADQLARRRRRAVRGGAVLVEVAHQQVRAAGVALVADLGEQPGHRDLGIFGAAPAEMVPVGVDERLAVARWTLRVLGGGGAGIPLDGVQCPAQPAGAVERDREEIHNGRLRRYYRLTDEGATALAVEAQRMAVNVRVATAALPARPIGTVPAGGLA